MTKQLAPMRSFPLFGTVAAFGLCVVLAACGSGETQKPSDEGGTGGNEDGTGGVSGADASVAGPGGSSGTKPEGSGAGSGGSARGGSIDAGGGGLSGQGGGSISGGTGGTSRDAGKADSGDSGSTCGCISYAISWGRIGGMVAYSERSTLDTCFKYTHRRDTYINSEPSLFCEQEEPLCDDGTAIGGEQVTTAIQNTDVQSALSKGNILYGSDPRPVDGVVFEIKVGEDTIIVGSNCATTGTGCLPIPKGVQNLADLLKKLDKEQLAKPPCNKTFAGGKTLSDCAPQKIPSDEPCKSPGRYYWHGYCMQTGCTCASGDCDPGFANQEACEAAYAGCSGIVTGCGGWAGPTCSADEYCAYRGIDMCGVADGGAICQPRPKVCDTIYAPVCACDGKTYSNECEANAAGWGVGRYNACE
jgi:hypothetical protein